MTSTTQAHFQPRPEEERLIRFAAVLLGIALAMAISAGLAGQVDRLSQPAGDAGITLGAAAPDASYDRVEKARAGFSLGAAPDASYDRVEKARAGLSLGAAADTSYDQVEKARAARN